MLDGSIVVEVAFALASITSVRVPLSKSAAPCTVFTILPIRSFLRWYALSTLDQAVLASASYSTAVLLKPTAH